MVEFKIDINKSYSQGSDCWELNKSSFTCEIFCRRSKGLEKMALAGSVLNNSRWLAFKSANQHQSTTGFIKQLSPNDPTVKFKRFPICTVQRNKWTLMNDTAQNKPTSSQIVKQRAMTPATKEGVFHGD